MRHQHMHEKRKGYLVWLLYCIPVPPATNYNLSLFIMKHCKSNFLWKKFANVSQSRPINVKTTILQKCNFFTLAVKCPTTENRNRRLHYVVKLISRETKKKIHFKARKPISSLRSTITTTCFYLVKEWLFWQEKWADLTYVRH